MRIPVNVDAEGRLLCPCHDESMVEARDQTQARPGETIWNCAEYAEVIEPYILRQLAEYYAGERNHETGSRSSGRAREH